MLRHFLLVATMATTGTAGAWTTMRDVAPVDTTIAVASEFATHPPAAWQADDPADSLYRAGREHFRLGLAARVDVQVVAARLQAQRHRRAHDPEADESQLAHDEVDSVQADMNLSRSACVPLRNTPRSLPTATKVAPSSR